MRWVRRWAAVLLLPVAFVVVTAPPAAAVFGCDADAPAPEVPGRGMTGFFIAPPDVLPPEDADPFGVNGKAPTATVYEVYGYAGMTFHTYTGECSPGPSDFTASSMTGAANVLMEIPKFMTAFTVAMTDVAYHPDFLDVFDPLVTEGTTALKEGLYDQWIPLAVVLVGLLIIVKWNRGTFRTATAAVGWALMVMVLASALFAWPLVAGSAADEVVPATLGTVASNINQSTGSGGGSDATSGLLVDTVVYDQWKRGTFGTTDSEAVDALAPQIFDGQALTWREATQVEQWLADDNQDAVDNLYDAKEKEWADAATALEQQDPDAYSNLVGNSSGTRFMAAVIALFAAICVCPFLWISAFLIICCFLIFRFAVIMSPALLTIGVLNTMSGIVTGAATVLAACLLNSVLFGIGSLLTLFGVGFLFAPDAGLPTWLALTLMLAWTVVMWYVLRPHKVLSSMVSPNRNVFADASTGLSKTGSRIWGGTKRFATSAGAAYVGTRAALAHDDDEQRPVDEDGRSYGGQVRPPAPYRRSESYTRPDTPAPGPAPALSAAPASAPAAPPAVGPAKAPQPALAPIPVVVPSKRNGSQLDVPVDAPTPVGTPAPTSKPAAIPVGSSAASQPVPDPGEPADLYRPTVTAPEVAPPPVEPQLEDGQAVYVIYNPEKAAAEDDR